ncbi:uncharacterized protein LOC110176599 [Drosophila serrata]|uniref:uncharacterized protein LOC110176599 n=1 Tax=Drosophila serrata TaxID=7274 RepID=UPI000A1D1463|nr:uncharacterized protein LOC110176599 [Drosophila serrata]KAH8361802.1 hypothetical protein KR200_000827 [Drosophila serrata]
MQGFKVCTLLAFFCVLVSARGSKRRDGTVTITDDERRNIEDFLLAKLKQNCRQEDDRACRMIKMSIVMNHLYLNTRLDLGDRVKVTENWNISMVPDDPEVNQLLARSMGSDEETFALLMANKLWKFIRSRSLRYSFSENADFVMSSDPAGSLNVGVSVRPLEAIQEGRGKMKNMGPLVMMMMAKTGMVGALLLKGLFLLAGKALIVSKIALLLAVIISLKKLLSSKKTIVEVPSHHDSYSSGWSRAFDGFVEGLVDVPADILAKEVQHQQEQAQNLAYSGQQPGKVVQ